MEMGIALSDTYDAVCLEVYIGVERPLQGDRGELENRRNPARDQELMTAPHTLVLIRSEIERRHLARQRDFGVELHRPTWSRAV